MKKIFKKTLLFLVLASTVFGTALFVPDCRADQNLNNWEEVLNKGAIPSGYQTDVQSPEPIIAAIIRAALSFLGVLFLVLMVYGGFLWMTARGNEDQVTKSKNLMTAAVIGLIIVLLSYAISMFVINQLTISTLEI